MGRGAILFLGSAVVLVLGFTVGRTTAPSPETQAPVAPRMPAVAGESAVLMSAGPDVRDRLRAIEERLGRIEEVLAAGGAGPVVQSEVERIREIWHPVIVEAVHQAEIESYRRRVLPALDRMLDRARKSPAYDVRTGKIDPERSRKRIEEFEKRRRELLSMETLAELEAFKMFARVHDLPSR